MLSLNGIFSRSFLSVLTLGLYLPRIALSADETLYWQVQLGGTQYVRPMELGQQEKKGDKNYVQARWRGLELDALGADVFQTYQTALKAKTELDSTLALQKEEKADDEDVKRATSAYEATYMPLGARIRKSAIEAKFPNVSEETVLSLVSGVGERDKIGVTFKFSNRQGKELYLIALVPAVPKEDGQLEMYPMETLRNKKAGEKVTPQDVQAVKLPAGKPAVFYRVLFGLE